MNKKTRKWVWTALSLLIVMLFLAACAPAARVTVFDASMNLPAGWTATEENDHSTTVTSADGKVSVNLICFNNTTTVDMTGEEFVSLENILETETEGFVRGRGENLEVVASEVLRTKSEPMLHVKLSFDADNERWVHDRYEFMHNGREYGLSGAWPENAAEADIKKAAQVIESLTMN